MRRPTARPIAVVTLLAVALLPAPAGAVAASARPGITSRVSVTSTGAQVAEVGTDPFNVPLSVSADGRYVTFTSAAAGLVPGDTGGYRDVFVHDRVRGTTERVSQTPAGQGGTGTSTAPVISADGRHVAFMSEADNLVAEDHNGVWDVFVADRTTGAVERVSVSSAEEEAQDWSRVPAISADGRYVAFDSAASNLVAGDTNGARTYDVFVRDRVAGTTERVSVNSAGAEVTRNSHQPSISGDGRLVSFYSDAAGLVPGDTNGYADVFVHDRATRTTRRVSVASDGTESNDQSFSASLSADGRYVAFQSTASNLVPNDRNVANDAFVHELASGRTERVSVSSAGVEHDALGSVHTVWLGTFTRASISGDGRYVAFQTTAANLHPGDSAGLQDVFIHDRVTRTTERVSGAPGGDSAGSARNAALSADGSVVVFASDAADLVADDTNGTLDVFARERGGPLDVIGVAVSRDADAVTVTGAATFSGAAVTVSDPVGDGGTANAVLDGDLVAVTAVARPELGDLLVRWDTAAMLHTSTPGGLGNALTVRGGIVPSAGASPGVIFELRFTVDGVAYALRAARPGSSAFALYRCAPCVKVADVDGGYGEAGIAVVAAMPLSLLGTVAAPVLTGVRATTAAGDPAAYGPLLIDDAHLPPVTLAAPRVDLGAAPAGESPAQWQAAGLVQGRFTSSLAAAAGDVLWARACLGALCGPARRSGG